MSEIEAKHDDERVQQSAHQAADSSEEDERDVVSSSLSHQFSLSALSLELIWILTE